MYWCEYKYKHVLLVNDGAMQEVRATLQTCQAQHSRIVKRIAPAQTTKPPASPESSPMRHHPPISSSSAEWRPVPPAQLDARAGGGTGVNRLRGQDASKYMLCGKLSMERTRSKNKRMAGIHRREMRRHGSRRADHLSNKQHALRSQCPRCVPHRLHVKPPRAGEKRARNFGWTNGLVGAPFC